MTTTPKRGGTRQGSGRPKKADSQKRVKTAITMKPEHYEATKGNRSGMIEKALSLMLFNPVQQMCNIPATTSGDESGQPAIQATG